jgi:hypothetical protein
MTDAALTDAQELRLLLRARALQAVAESSEYAPEAHVFTTRAQAMVDRYGIEPELLEYPREPLPVAVVISEARRLQAILGDFDDDPETWATKSAEWSDSLDEYDQILEVAADLFNIAVHRLPWGSRRHFRTVDRAEIERVLTSRMNDGSNATELAVTPT